MEAEKEAFRTEKGADREIHRADRIQRKAQASEDKVVLYERETIERPGEEVTVVMREWVREPEGGVRIEKDKKGRMAISVPKYCMSMIDDISVCPLVGKSWGHFTTAHLNETRVASVNQPSFLINFYPRSRT